jgi:anti-anti-sigma factor
VNLTITIRKEGRVAVLCPAGQLTVRNAQLVRGSIQKQLEENTDSFCFDLSALDHIDSAGVGELIRIYSSVRKEGSLARFRKISSGFRELLHVARL